MDRKSQRRGREWIVSIALVTVSLMLPLAAGEILLRVLASAPDIGKLFAEAPDSEVESRGVAFARGRYAGAPVVLNSLGMREREFAPAHGRGTFRIVVLGDSMSFGQGAPQEGVWPRVMEAKLAEARPAGIDVIEVINLSVPGYNTLQELAQLREVGLGLHPDLVVVGFFYNDVELTPRQLARLDPGSAAGTSSGAADMRSSINRAITALKGSSLLFAYLSPRIGAVFRRFGGKGFGQTENYNAMYGADMPGWVQARNALLEMKALAAQAGSDFVVVVIPAMVNCAPQTYPMQKYHDAMSAFAHDNAITHVDLLRQLRGIDFSRMWVSPTDGHPDAEAHRLLGEAAARALAAHLATTAHVRHTRATSASNSPPLILKTATK